MISILGKQNVDCMTGKRNTSTLFSSIFLAPASKLFRVTWVNKLHLHFTFYTVRFGVLVFRGVPVFRAFPLFRGVPVFRFRGVPVFRCSGVPAYSGVPGFSTCRRHPNIKFTMELEKNREIPYLDVCIKRDHH